MFVRSQLIQHPRELAGSRLDRHAASLYTRLDQGALDSRGARAEGGEEIGAAEEHGVVAE